MQRFSIFSLCTDRNVEKRNSEDNENNDSKRFNSNDFFRNFSRTNLCITRQDFYKYSRQCEDYIRTNCMCCNRKVTPEKLQQPKESNGTPVIPINLSPDVHIKAEENVTPLTEHISKISSPSVNRTNSTILLSSTEDPDDEIVYDYTSTYDSVSNKIQNENRVSAHSNSSSKKFDSMSNKMQNENRVSAHSNSSSRKSLEGEIFDASSPLTVIAADETYQKSQPNSRPISVLSAATTKSLYEDYELRPCTSASKSNQSSASLRSNNNKSRSSLVADENDRPTSNVSRATVNTNANEDNIEGAIEKQSLNDNYDDKTHMDVNQSNDPEILVLDESVVDADIIKVEDDINVEYIQNDNVENIQDEEAVNIQYVVVDKPEEIESIQFPEAQEKIDVINTQIQLISSDNESNCTEVAEEVDFVKERSDEHTTASTVSSVQNFSVRPSIRFRKRKVSPTKSVVPLSSRQKPKDQHLICLQQLDSSNWDQIMVGLQTFVCLMRNNPEQIEPQLHQYCLALSKNIKNLRSQVSRASCQAAGEFFESHSKLLEQESDDLALALLNRTADTNKFLRSDATKALKIMCETLPIPKVIQIVTTKGATHQNAVVRTASANLCNQIIDRCGTDKIFSMNRDLRDKLILTGANLLLEGSLDTRNYAKLLFKQLSHHPSYHKTILDVIPPRIYRNIEKTLKNI